VIEQTIQQKLPEGFQRAEFLLEHGMVDMIVERSRLKATLSMILRYLSVPGIDDRGNRTFRPGKRPPRAVPDRIGVFPVRASGKAFRTLHVAGTNGKGSTASFAYDILRCLQLGPSACTPPRTLSRPRSGSASTGKRSRPAHFATGFAFRSVSRLPGIR